MATPTKLCQPSTKEFVQLFLRLFTCTACDHCNVNSTLQGVGYNATQNTLA